MLGTQTYQIPWREVWFPINLGTCPFWGLFLLWLFAAIFWTAGSTNRRLILAVGMPGFCLFPVAILWVFLHRMLELVDIGYSTAREGSSGLPDVGFDPNTWTGYLMMGATEASGVSAVFAVIVAITAGAVVLFYRANNKQEAEQGMGLDAE